MSPEQWFASLGVGGVLAGMVFFFYRKDVNFIMSTLVQVVKENTASSIELREAVRENSSAVKELRAELCNRPNGGQGHQ